MRKVVFYSDFIEKGDLWDEAVCDRFLQQGNDLGTRMRHAFESEFQKGTEAAVLIGTDCPELTSGIIMQAFAYLRAHDVVIGPAKDGGYYLLAMKQCHKQLFESISWSTERVLSQTLEICREADLDIRLLQALSDVDTEEDWKTAMLHQSMEQHD